MLLPVTENLKDLSDANLLSQAKYWVENERLCLTQVIRHLDEVNRRRLYSELGYDSLFHYAIRELGYSDGQAGRRLNALRLLESLDPKNRAKLEEKIEAGDLNLTVISQAQVYFRKSKEQNHPFQTSEKIELLGKLEKKSAREAEKILLQLQPGAVLPEERERQITASHSEIRFIMSEDLKLQLEEVRSLLGSQGASMSFAELVGKMAELSLVQLKTKRFGKARSQKVSQVLHTPAGELRSVDSGATSSRNNAFPDAKMSLDGRSNSKSCALSVLGSDSGSPVRSESRSKNPRYISKALQFQVWQRDRGCCRQCGSRRHLQYDHIQPVAYGGIASFNNLRLLCRSCNQRQAIRTMGLEKMQLHLKK